MRNLDGSASVPATLAALDLVGVNVGFARAVVEDLADGQLWAVETADGWAFHSVHSYGMSLIWGSGVAAAYDELIGRLRDGSYRGRDEWLQIDPAWSGLGWSDDLAEVPGWSEHERVNFSFDPSLFGELRAGVRLPQGWVIERADRSDFERPGSVVPSAFWRNANDFLAAGGGWRIVRDGFRGALAFTSFRFGDELELGIETHPDARGMGLATAVTAGMIDDLLTRGITPVWSCRASNTGSVAVACRLGFRPTIRLPYYRLAATR